MNKNEIIIRTICALTLTAIAFLTGGCASIVHGGARNITVASQPAGAKITITKPNTGETVHSGMTPMTVNLDPKKGFFAGQSYVVKFELQGYKNTEVSIQPVLSGWYLGNIVFGGLIGMLIVDPASGAMWNLTPDKIDQPLTAEQASIVKGHKGFLVVLVSQLTESEKANMKKIN